MSESQKVALITGGAKRVGRAIAQTLASAGYDIVFTYRTSESAANELVASLRSMGRRSLAIQADLADPEPAADLIHREVRHTFGRLDILVNNASIYTPTPLQQVKLKELQRFMAIHAYAPLLLCQRFESMLRAGGGHVINMVDILAERPWPQYVGYCASKAALLNQTLSLARELAPQVTVNGIAPGIVEWPEDMPQAERDAYLNNIPLQRAGSPQDVARLVLYLITDGSYITGQIIRLDGGRSVVG